MKRYVKTPRLPSESSRILIVGAAGHLGKYFQAAYPQAVCPVVDIANTDAVANVMRNHEPYIVINCAGKTGRPNVDWCEVHRVETVYSNVTGPLVLLRACKEHGCYLVHLSSGCIYAGDNGGGGFRESDPPNFRGSLYARTKIWAEQVLCEFPCLILRLRMPFDGTPSPRNLLMKLRGYRHVLCVPNSLTHLPDFVSAAQALIDRRATGIYNVVNRGVISPFEIMEMYRTIINPEHRCEPLSAKNLSKYVRAQRSNCQLDTTKLKSEGLELPPVREAVENALRFLKNLVLGND